MTPSQAELIAAIEQGRVDRLAARADSIRDTCRTIARAVADEQRRVVQTLTAAGIDTTPQPVGELLQRHGFVVSLDAADAPTAAGVLTDRLGYRRHPAWTGGADRSFWATSHEVALTRSDDATYVARLRWATPAPSGTAARLFRPTPADWATVRLPSRAWRAYSIVRPVRLLRERIVGAPDHAALEPFLATPTSLIGPLLDLAGVTADDVVADIGCGDGRIVVAAAERHGCRTVGFEFDADLVAAARRRAEAAGLADRVTIHQGDGLAADLAEVTVVVLFVPTGVAARAVPALLERLPAGARIVLHEQSRLPTGMPEPGHSEPVVTADAITVARRWVVG